MVSGCWRQDAGCTSRWLMAWLQIASWEFRQTAKMFLWRRISDSAQPRLTIFKKTFHRKRNVISALALDRDGKFWAGNFRRGIDVFSSEGRKLAHLESEAIREVNFLLPEMDKDGAVLAATSQGIVRFDSQFHSTNMTKADG